MSQVRRLPSLWAVVLSSLLSAALTVVGLSLASDRIVEFATRRPVSKPGPAIEQTYEVQRGDSLSLIAARELGSTERWHELYAANRDRLRTPSELEVGTTLRLPGAER